MDDSKGYCAARPAAQRLVLWAEPVAADKELDMKSKKFIAVLILLNVVVLIGQVWPEGAPPFARAANIVCLVATLAFLVNEIRS